MFGHVIHCTPMVYDLLMGLHVEYHFLITYMDEVDESLHVLVYQMGWRAHTIYGFKNEMKDEKVVHVDLGVRGHLKMPLYFHGTIHAWFQVRRLQGNILTTGFSFQKDIVSLPGVGSESDKEH